MCNREIPNTTHLSQIIDRFGFSRYIAKLCMAKQLIIGTDGVPINAN